MPTCTAPATSPHAIAAGLDGSLGLAMQNGTIDTRLLQNLLGPVLQKANLLTLLSHGGSSDLRCFALRADAQHGVAELRALDLNSSVLTMDGTGSVNLGEETLALQLRPQGRLAGTTIIVVPLRVTGPIRSPDVMVNAIGAAESNAGTVAGAVISNATPLGLLGGMLGGGKLLDSSSGGFMRRPAGAGPRPSRPGARRRIERADAAEAEAARPGRCCMICSVDQSLSHDGGRREAPGEHAMCRPDHPHPRCFAPRPLPRTARES